MFDFLTKELREKNGNLHRQVTVLEEQRAAIAAPMFIVDTDLVINFINDAALFAMGYRRDEVVGKMTCADFFLWSHDQFGVHY